MEDEGGDNYKSKVENSQSCFSGRYSGEREKPESEAENRLRVGGKLGWHVPLEI